MAVDKRKVSNLTSLPLALANGVRNRGGNSGKITRIRFAGNGGPLKSANPDNLIYGLDDRPPWQDTLVLAFQHFIILTPRLVYTAIIVQGFNGSPETAAAIMAMSMIAAGIGAFMQVNRKGPVGSGYLDPPSCGAAYIYPSIQAGLIGGPALVFGMTIFAGAVECLFSRVFYRLRALFPPHVIGLVVTMVGLSLIKTAVTRFVGGTSATGPSEMAPSVITGLTTLLVIIGVSVWGKGKLKIYSLLAGIVAGYAMALLTGTTSWENLRGMLSVGFPTFPDLNRLDWSFDRSLCVVFVIASISTALKTSGEILTCQKINDPGWQHPDMKPVAGGLLADGAYTVLSGLIGGVGLSSSSANIGLSLATKATSRRIAYATGCIMIGLAFVPALPYFFTNMPKAVAGASLIFVSSFMVVTGIQMMTLRMLDARKTYVIGLSFIFGLSVDIVPGLYTSVEPWLKPMFSSSLSLATISAILLNLLFRIGVAFRVEQVVGENGNIPSSKDIFNFMEANGNAWAARKDVILRASSALVEVVENIVGNKMARGPVKVLVAFDEFSLDLEIAYEGEPMRFPCQNPCPVDWSDEENGLGNLAGFMVRKLADQVKTKRNNDDCLISLHFNH
jgi:xanthine permease XanP